MSTKLSDKDAKDISDLIKIHIPDKDLGKYASQLNTVLEAVEVLKELDTNNTAETSQTHGLVNVMVADEISDGLDMKQYQNRKNFHNGYFVVGRVL